MTALAESSSLNTQYHGRHFALVGMGVSGKASARFLLSQGAKVTVFDKQALNREILIKELSIGQAKENAFHCELLLPNSQLADYDHIVLSPGIDPKQAPLSQFIATEKLISDLDLFAAHNHLPCIGITGSNGKSTVVDMLRCTLNACGLNVALGGNFGVAALDLLNQDADVVVLELSSFQLEITQSLPLNVACILNVTEDHIDRHQSLENYAKAKQRIFEHAQKCIVNRDDHLTFPHHSSESAVSILPSSTKSRGNSMNSEICVSVSQINTEEYDSDFADSGHFYQDAQGIYLNHTKLIDASSLHLPLPHLMFNMQVVLAVHYAMQLPIAPALAALKAYKGLPHRFELIGENAELRFVNDSKATNPGACAVALKCVEALNWPTILIAGGDAKGADLQSLKSLFESALSACIVFGKDANKLIDIYPEAHKVKDLNESFALALSLVRQMSETNSSHAQQQQPYTILLSPACASTDMFRNYEQRGELFRQLALGVL